MHLIYLKENVVMLDFYQHKITKNQFIFLLDSWSVKSKQNGDGEQMFWFPLIAQATYATVYSADVRDFRLMLSNLEYHKRRYVEDYNS